MGAPEEQAAAFVAKVGGCQIFVRKSGQLWSGGRHCLLQLVAASQAVHSQWPRSLRPSLLHHLLLLAGGQYLSPAEGRDANHWPSQLRTLRAGV